MRTFAIYTWTESTDISVSVKRSSSGSMHPALLQKFRSPKEIWNNLNQNQKYSIIAVGGILLVIIFKPNSGPHITKKYSLSSNHYINILLSIKKKTKRIWKRTRTDTIKILEQNIPRSKIKIPQIMFQDTIRKSPSHRYRSYTGRSIHWSMLHSIHTKTKPIQ